MKLHYTNKDIISQLRREQCSSPPFCFASVVMLLLKQIIHAYLIQVGFLQASPLGLGMWYIEVYSQASDVARLLLPGVLLLPNPSLHPVCRHCAHSLESRKVITYLNPCNCVDQGHQCSPGFSKRILETSCSFCFAVFTKLSWASVRICI